MAERSRMGLRSCFIIKSHRTPEIVPRLFARQLYKQPNDQPELTNYRVPSRPENRTMVCVYRGASPHQNRHESAAHERAVREQLIKYWPDETSQREASINHLFPKRCSKPGSKDQGALSLVLINLVIDVDFGRTCSVTRYKDRLTFDSDSKV